MGGLSWKTVLRQTQQLSPPLKLWTPCQQKQTRAQRIWEGWCSCWKPLLSLCTLMATSWGRLTDDEKDRLNVGCCHHTNWLLNGLIFHPGEDKPQEGVLYSPCGSIFAHINTHTHTQWSFTTFELLLKGAHTFVLLRQIRGLQMLCAWPSMTTVVLSLLPIHHLLQGCM